MWNPIPLRKWQLSCALCGIIDSMVRLGSGKIGNTAPFFSYTYKLLLRLLGKIAWENTL